MHTISAITNTLLTLYSKVVAAGFAQAARFFAQSKRSCDVHTGPAVELKYKQQLLVVPTESKPEPHCPYMAVEVDTEGHPTTQLWPPEKAP